jgi:hypothetical protein
VTNEEINIAVARKLTRPELCRHGNDGSCVYCLPRVAAYSTSIEAAWEVVDKILEPSEGKLPNRFMLSFLNVKGWDCTINGFHLVADTAPMAICLMFLKLEDR